MAHMGSSPQLNYTNHPDRFSSRIGSTPQLSGRHSPPTLMVEGRLATSNLHLKLHSPHNDGPSTEAPPNPGVPPPPPPPNNNNTAQSKADAQVSWIIF